MINIQSIKIEYGPEIALAVLFLRLKLGKANRDELNEFLDNNPIELSKFLTLLEAHQIESIINSVQAFREFYSNYDDVINFKRKVEYRSRFNMVLVDEIINLNRLFQNVGFPVLFYKGVVLSKLLFGDFTTRVTGDIDVMIHADNFSAFRKILVNAGYEEVYFYPADYPNYYLKEIGKQYLGKNM